MADLVIDIGNTRIKWARVEKPPKTDPAIGGAESPSPLGPIHAGPTSRLAHVIEALSCDKLGLNGDSRVLICNVARPGIEDILEKHLLSHGFSASHLQRFGSSSGTAGLISRYAPSLGPDRLASAIGAWHLGRHPCLVVSCGTATTLDVVHQDDDGRPCFAGGVILPGIDLMKHSLVEGTARLPMTHGHYQWLPCSTEDAMATGILEAQFGALQRLQLRLAPESRVWITGGAGQRFLHEGQANHAFGQHPVLFHENLVLEGLARVLAHRI